MLTSNTMKRNQQKNNWATTAMKKGGHCGGLTMVAISFKSI